MRVGVTIGKTIFENAETFPSLLVRVKDESITDVCSGTPGPDHALL